MINIRQIVLFCMLLLTAAISVPAEDGAKLQSDNYAILSKAQEDMEKFEYKSAKLKLDIMLKKKNCPHMTRQWLIKH